MKLPSRRVLLLSLLGAVPVIGVLVLLSGVIPVAASNGHAALTEWVLKLAMRRSVATHSMGISIPELRDDRLILLGAGHYDSACRFCHGAPGMALPAAAAGSAPSPPDLTQVTERYDSAELFYIIRHGVKFTGMPGWPSSGRDDEVWAMVAFLQAWPKLDRAKYSQLALGPGGEESPKDAPLSLQRCARCHGPRGQGRGQAFPVLAAQNAKYIEASLLAYAEGKRPSAIMEQQADLTADERWKLSLWFAAQPAAPPAGTLDGTEAAHREGRSIAEHGIPARKIPSCNDCHGPKRKVRDGYPLLSGQPSAYLARQLRLFATGTRGGSPFAALMESVQAHALRPNEIQAVSSYFSSLSPDVEDRADE